MHEMAQRGRYSQINNFLNGVSVENALDATQSNGRGDPLPFDSIYVYFAVSAKLVFQRKNLIFSHAMLQQVIRHGRFQIELL